MSFHHVEWVPMERIEGEHLGKHRVKKFLQKWNQDGQRGEVFKDYLKVSNIFYCYVYIYICLRICVWQ